MKSKFDVSYIDGSEFDLTNNPELQAISKHSEYEIQRCGNHFRAVFLDDGFELASVETVKQEEDKVYILEFDVHEEMRGLGVGTFVLEAIEDVLRREDLKYIFVDDRDKIAFFVKNGYTSEKDHYYKDLTCVSTSADQS